VLLVLVLVCPLPGRHSVLHLHLLRRDLVFPYFEVHARPVDRQSLLYVLHLGDALGEYARDE
jgi:hypothetical protein